MFVAYALGFIIPRFTALYLYLRQVSGFWFSAIIIGEMLVLWPLIFRYSRVLWLHADQLMDLLGGRHPQARLRSLQNAIQEAHSLLDGPCFLEE